MFYRFFISIIVKKMKQNNYTIYNKVHQKIVDIDYYGDINIDLVKHYFNSNNLHIILNYKNNMKTRTGIYYYDNGYISEKFVNVNSKRSEFFTYYKNGSINRYKNYITCFEKNYHSNGLTYNRYKFNPLTQTKIGLERYYNKTGNKIIEKYHL